MAMLHKYNTPWEEKIFLKYVALCSIICIMGSVMNATTTTPANTMPIMGGLDLAMNLTFKDIYFPVLFSHEYMLIMINSGCLDIIEDVYQMDSAV